MGQILPGIRLWYGPGAEAPGCDRLKPELHTI